MKTNFLIAVALFVSGTALAQEATSKNAANTKVQIQSSPNGAQAGASGNASSTTTVRGTSETIHKAAAKVDKTKQVVKEEVKDQQEAAAAEIKKDVNFAKQTVQEDRQVAATVNTETGIQATTAEHQVSSVAAVNAKAAISSKSALAPVQQVTNHGLTTAKQKAAVVKETVTSVKPIVKPTPVNTQLQGKVKTGIGLGIH